MNKAARNLRAYEKRSKTWPKTIRMRLRTYQYILSHKKVLGLKTLSGTLDYVINQYRKNLDS